MEARGQFSVLLCNLFMQFNRNTPGCKAITDNTVFKIIAPSIRLVIFAANFAVVSNAFVEQPAAIKFEHAFAPILT